MGREFGFSTFASSDKSGPKIRYFARENKPGCGKKRDARWMPLWYRSSKTSEFFHIKMAEGEKPGHGSALRPSGSGGGENFESEDAELAAGEDEEVSAARTPH